MAFNSFNSTEIEVGKPIKESLWTKTSGNFDNHETRVNALEAGAYSKVIVLNEIVELDVARTGDIKYSLLTETQYQAKFGTDWVLIDGGSITGTDLAALYGTTLPDGRLRFPRILGSGLSLGQLEANQNKSHNHAEYGSNGGRLCSVGAADPAYAHDGGSGGANYGTVRSTGSEGGTEARPNSFVMNAFIRKNDYALTSTKLFKAPYGFNFISAIVTTLEAGSEGTLEVDILSGTTLGSLSSIFSTRPSVAFGAGSNASSTNSVISNAAVATSDWIQMDITSLQTGQDRYFVYLLGELA